MKLVDPVRPPHELPPGFGRRQPKPADFDVTIRVRSDGSAEMPGEHLRAETEAEKRRPLPQRYADPVCLLLEILVAVVDAHWPAENDGAGVVASVSGNASPKRGRRISSG